jgi:hypothetical protein
MSITNSRPNALRALLGTVLATVALLTTSSALAQNGQTICDAEGVRTITAKVVVFDSPTVFNRLGAQNPNWITYALRRDVVQVAAIPDPDDPEATIGVPGAPEAAGGVLMAGNVELRPDKRTRPLVVRSVAGACLTVKFTNLLAGPGVGNNPNQAPGGANPNNAQQDALFNDDQVAGRCASFHASGTEVVDNILDDGSMVGNNPDASLDPAACGGGLVPPNGTITYNLYTPHEGAFVINSYGATLGSEANSGNLAVGMFGQLNVEPKGAKMYRGQLTEEEMRLATVDIDEDGIPDTVPSDCMFDLDGKPIGIHGVTCNPGGQPIINYEAVYPNVAPWDAEGKAGLPIINMLNGNELVHSDINAIIVGPLADGTFPNDTYPLESTENYNNPQLPNRLEPFREFTSIFHDEQTNSQVFPRWYTGTTTRCSATRWRASRTSS